MSFSNPPPAPAEDPSANSPSFGIGSSLAISWTNTTSAYSNATLVLMKNDSNYTCSLLNLGLAFCEAIQPSFNAATSLEIPWRVSTYSYPEYPTDINPSYYLIMAAFDTSGVVSKFYSHGFFIYPEDDVPTSTYEGSTSSTAITTTSSTAFSSLTSSGITSSSITSSTTPSAASSTTSAPSSGLKPGDKVAIGVSVGLGLPLIIAVTVIALFLLKRGRKYSHPPATATPGGYQSGKHFSAFSRDGSEGWATTGTQAPSEKGSRSTPMHQAQSWQSQQQQPFFTELPAENRSAR